MAKNKYNNITKLLESNYWGLSVWESRYGRGFYASVMRLHYANVLQDILTGSDVEAVELECYLNGKGKWLPVCHGESIEDALCKLDAKLEKWLDKNEWYDRVDEALYAIEKNDGNYKLKELIW